MSRSTSVSTGALAVGTTVIREGISILNSINVTTDGANAATVTLYDNITASGKVIAVVALPAASLSGHVNFTNGIRTEIGLTAVVAGTGATAYISHGGA